MQYHYLLQAQSLALQVTLHIYVSRICSHFSLTRELMSVSGKNEICYWRIASFFLKLFSLALTLFMHFHDSLRCFPPFWYLYLCIISFFSWPALQFHNSINILCSLVLFIPKLLPPCRRPILYAFSKISEV